MSLSSVLETDEQVIAYFRGLVPTLPKLPRPAPPLAAPPRSPNYGLVGTAFDYLFRWRLERLNPGAISRPWLAEETVPVLAPARQRVGAALVRRAKRQHAEFLATGELTRSVCEAALSLARLDAVFRSGRGTQEIEVPPLAADIDDLMTLVAAIPQNGWVCQDRCLLNPTFGRASQMVGGADADVVLDDLLVEVKTTKHFTLERMTVHQLIGYVLLGRIAGMHRDPESVERVARIGVYSARYATLVTWPLDSVVAERMLSKAAEWFHAHLAAGPKHR